MNGVKQIRRQVSKSNLAPNLLDPKFTGMDIVLLFLGGFLSSAVLSLAGLGGGLVLVPWLTLFLSYDINRAVFFSLASILALSTLQNIKNREFIRESREKLKPLLIFSAIGAVGSAYLQQYVSHQLASILFAILMIVLSLIVLLKNTPILIDGHTKRPRLVAKAFFVFSGFLCGFFGVGGGSINVPVLHRMEKVPLRDATRLSFVFITLASAFALLVHFHYQKADLYQLSPYLLFYLLMGTLSGAWVATKLKINNTALKIFIALVIFTAGVLKLVKSLPL